MAKGIEALADDFGFLLAGFLRLAQELLAVRGAGGDGVHFGRKVGVLELTVETVVRSLEFLAGLEQGTVIERSSGVAPEALWCQPRTRRASLPVCLE